MHWILLTIAVCANIVANIMFKIAMKDMPGELSAKSILQLAAMPSLWAGAISCVVLLASYLLAIRELGISTSYAFVTSISLLGITITAAFVFSEALTLTKMLGVVIVIVGITMISRAEIV